MQQQSQPGFQQQSMQHDANMAQRQNKNSVGSTMSGSTDAGAGDYSDDGADTKPQTRGGRGGKKGGSGGKAANGKRKAEETPSKGGNKKARASNGSNMPDDMDDEDPGDEMEGQR